MFHINDAVKRPWKLTAKWYNLVASWLNNVCGDGIIEIVRPNEPKPTSPVVFRINIDELRSKAGIGKPSVLQMRVEVNAAGTAVSKVYVYLPTDRKLVFGADEYTVTSGTATGNVAQQSSGNNWFEIKGFAGYTAATTIYLVKGATDGSAIFATTKPSQAGAFSYFVGTISPTAVSQYGAAMSGNGGFGYAGGPADATPRPFEVKAVVNSGKTAVSEVRIYLPTTTVTFGRTAYPLRTGSTTGYVQAVSGEAGWYEIVGFTTGNLYLIDDSIQTTSNTVAILAPRAKFSSAAHGTKNRLSVLVASVSYTSGEEAATVTQYEPPKQGRLGDGSEVEQDGQGTVNICLTSANDTTRFTQEGHHLNTDKWQRGVTVLSKVATSGDNNTLTPVTDSDGRQQPCGCTVRVITRIVRSVDTDFFVYREMEFDKNGMLRLLSEEKGAALETNGVY